MSNGSGPSEIAVWISTLNQSITSAMAPVNVRLRALEDRMGRLEETVLSVREDLAKGTRSGGSSKGKSFLGADLTGGQFVSIIIMVCILLGFSIIAIAGGEGKDLNDFVRALRGKEAIAAPLDDPGGR